MTPTTDISPANAIDLAELNGTFKASEPEKMVAWAATRVRKRSGDDFLLRRGVSHALAHGYPRAAADSRYHGRYRLSLPRNLAASWKQLRQRFDLNVWVYRTRNDPIAYLHKAGEENPAFRNDRDACCGANKNEPMDRAMRELAPRLAPGHSPRSN